MPPAASALCYKRPCLTPCCSLARTADKLVARGRSLVEMYKEVGVDRDRVLLRMPATWAAIQVGASCSGVSSGWAALRFTSPVAHCA